MHSCGYASHNETTFHVQVDVTSELKDIMQVVFDDSSMPDKLGIGRDYQQKEVFKYARWVAPRSTDWW